MKINIFLYGFFSLWALMGSVFALEIPTLNDEKQTYRKWGWTWNSSAEPAAVTEPISNYYVGNPDIHSDTEGDDLWTYINMYRRTGNPVYLNRANAWARYFKDDYRQCIPSSGSNYCYDVENFGGDHRYGWGLVSYYEYTGNLAYLTAAENLAADVEARVGNATPGSMYVDYYGMREWARQLLLATRVAEATGKARWMTLRDKLLGIWLQSPDWDSRGMYFESAEQTDYALGSGAYASGIRQNSTFQIGVAMEALYHAYRTTGRTAVRDRMVAMARFVNQYGMDATYQYSGSRFGLKNGVMWHNYSSGGSASFWDPVYTTSLVNTLVLGYKYTGDVALLNRAQQFFNRGTKGVYGSVTQRTAPDNVVHHFVDTKFDTSSDNIYLSYNKGELQYTYLLFENGGNPLVGIQDNLPPAAPTQLRVE